MSLPLTKRTMENNPLHAQPNPDGYYASLVGVFLGYYVEIKGARNNMAARMICNADRRLKRCWCSIYDLEHTIKSINKFGGQIIEIGEADCDIWEINEQCKEYDV